MNQSFLQNLSMMRRPTGEDAIAAGVAGQFAGLQTGQELGQAMQRPGLADASSYTSRHGQPFTYRSSARPMQSTPSFADLLDAERAKTTAAVSQLPTAVNGALNTVGKGLQDATSGGGDGGGGYHGGDFGGGGSGGTSGNGGSVNGNGGISTGFGGHSVGFGSSTATANTTGFSNGQAAKAGGVFGAPGALVAGFTNNAINASAQKSADAFNTNMADAIANSAPATNQNTDDGEANQAAAQDAAQSAAADASSESQGGVTGGSASATDASSAGAVNGSDAQSDAAGGAATGGGEGEGDGGDGFARGGRIGLRDIQRFVPGGPNRAGVDDGLASADAGDFILTARRTKEIGPTAMKALLDGRAEIVMLKGKK